MSGKTIYTPEQESALRTIRRMVEFWDISMDDIRRAPAPPKPPPPPTKYRHPMTGEEWNGTGPQPQWLRKALLDEGFTVEELRPQER